MGPKKVLAVILLATTAVASGVIVRSGTTQEPGRSASRGESAALLARYESPILRSESVSAHATPERTANGAMKPGTNRTELLAQSLAKEILKRNPNGPELLGNSWSVSILPEEELNRIIDEQAAQFDPGTLLAVVPDEGIKIIKRRSAPELQRYFDQSLLGVRDTLQKLALPKQDFSEADVKKLAAAYGEISERLAALSVPEDLAPFHKQQLALFLTQKNFFEAVLGYNDDPVGAMVVARHGDFFIRETERELTGLQAELSAFLNEKLSLYPPDDAKSIAERILFIQRAHATLPVIDAEHIIAAIANSISEIVSSVMEWVKDAARWAADKAWILAVEVLKKRLLDMIVDQIVAWIQGGGTPKFITDWQGFLLDAANAGVGDIVKQLGLGFLCSPFNLQIKLALSPIPKFSQRASCTLDKIVSNIENFYSDFRNGGWIAYQTQWQPANNYYGSVLMAYDEALTEGARRKEAAKNEGTADQGFLSTKRCVQKTFDDDGVEIGCAKFEVTTPGKTIGDTLSKAVGSDIDYIVNARDLSAYIAAIADAAINRLVRAGVDGIRGVSTPSAPSGGFVAPGVTGPCAGLTGAALLACLNAQIALGNVGSEAKRPMLDIIGRILPEKQGALDQKRVSLAIVTQPSTGIIALLTALAACNPSDPTLQQFSVPSFQTTSQGLQSQITTLNGQVTTLSTLRTNIQNVPNDRLDLLQPLITQLQQYIEQNGGDWAAAKKEREDATAEKNQLQSQQAQIRSALTACQAQGQQQPQPQPQP